MSTTTKPMSEYLGKKVMVWCRRCQFHFKLKPFKHSLICPICHQELPWDSIIVRDGHENRR